MFQETPSTHDEAYRPRELDHRTAPPAVTSGANAAPSLEDLLRGDLEIAAIGRIDTAFTVTFRRLARRRRALSRKERIIFERLVRGSCQKEIAYDLGVALTTVSAHVRFALQKLGIGTWEAAVLVVAALEHGVRVDGATEDAEARTQVFKVELSEAELARLTEAERVVALFALDGCTNAEIAVIRRSSPRTVANQVASTFRKLGVRCRLELIRCLAGVPRVSEVRMVASVVLSMGDVARPQQAVLEPMVVAK